MFLWFIAKARTEERTFKYSFINLHLKLRVKAHFPLNSLVEFLLNCYCISQHSIYSTYSSTGWNLTYIKILYNENVTFRAYPVESLILRPGKNCNVQEIPTSSIFLIYIFILQYVYFTSCKCSIWFWRFIFFIVLSFLCFMLFLQVFFFYFSVYQCFYYFCDI